jgi:hypothetical protein
VSGHVLWLVLSLRPPLHRLPETVPHQRGRQATLLLRLTAGEYLTTSTSKVSSWAMDLFRGLQAYLNNKAIHAPTLHYTTLHYLTLPLP